MGKLNDEVWARSVESLRGRTPFFVHVRSREDSFWCEDVQNIIRGQGSNSEKWGVGGDLRFPLFPGYHFTAEPFNVFSSEELYASLSEVPPRVACDMLVLIALGSAGGRRRLQSYTQLPNILAGADALLASFGSSVSFWTNADDAEAVNETLDFKISELASFTPYPIDFGLVAVSDTDVGVFWTFDAS